jgi:T-complex protein 1 subunit delta
MDKMIQAGNGEVTITNDGATILAQMSVIHPTAKMVRFLLEEYFIHLLFFSWLNSQKRRTLKREMGPLLLLSSLERCWIRPRRCFPKVILKCLFQTQSLGIHPTTISESFQRAATKAEEVLDAMSHPLDISNDEELIKLATTSLNSKVVSQHSWLLAPMAVSAVKKIVDVQKDTNVNLQMIKLVKKLGDTVEESQLIDGALIEQKSMGHGGPSRVDKAKIGLIQFQISPPKTNVSFLYRCIL